VPANDCLRTHDRRGVADIGKTPIQPDEQRPITVWKPQPFRSLSVQNAQLMPKDEDFGFQSFMRTKAVPHISEQKSEEGRHRFRAWSDSLFYCESSGWGFRKAQVGEYPAGDHVLVLGKVIDGKLLDSKAEPMAYAKPAPWTAPLRCFPTFSAIEGAAALVHSSCLSAK
jgi:hypothetical protein